MSRQGKCIINQFWFDFVVRQSVLGGWAVKRWVCAYTHTHAHTQAVSSACSVLFVRACLYLNQAVCCLSSPRLCVTLPFANKLRLLSKTCDSQHHRGGMDVFLKALFWITWSDSVCGAGETGIALKLSYSVIDVGAKQFILKKPRDEK